MTAVNVKPTTGNDNSTDFKTLDFAVAQASSGDILTISETTKTNPIRGSVNVVQDITVQTDGTKAYLAGSMDMSNDKTIGNVLENGSCDAWLDANTMYGINNDKLPVKETTIVNTAGGASIKCDDKFEGVLWGEVILPGNSSCTFYFSAYQVETDSRMILTIRNVSSGNYLRKDGTWGANLLDNTFDVGTINTWEDFSFAFTTEDAEGQFSVAIDARTVSAGDIVYIDDVSLVPDGTWPWIDQGDGTWAVKAYAGGAWHVFACPTADWTSDGIEAFEFQSQAFMTKAASKVAMQAAANSWWADTSSGEIFVNLDASANHIEIIFVLIKNSPGPAAYINNDAVLDNLSINLMRVGLDCRGQGTNAHSDFVSGDFKTYDCSIKNTINQSMMFQGSTVIPEHYNFECSFGRIKDGCISGYDAHPKYYGGKVHHMNDDGIQSGNVETPAQGLGGVTAVGVSVYSNGIDDSNGHGIALEITVGIPSAGPYTIRNCSAYLNDIGYKLENNAGIAITTVMTDSWSQGNNSYGIEVQNLTGLTMNRMHWDSGNVVDGGSLPSGSDGNLDSTTQTILNPPTVDSTSGSLHISSGSAAIGAASKWWGTDPRPAGTDEEPFSDLDTDIGGIQSTYSSGHPENL